MPPQLTKEYATALQIIARALIRSLHLTSPEISGRVLLLQTSFEVLEEIVTAGAIDAATVADAVLCDGLAAFGPVPELFGLFTPHMGPSVCQEVGRQFDIEGSLPQLDADGRRRLRTELALGAHDGHRVLQLLEDWPDPPYGELMARTWFLELPIRASIAQRALAAGAVRWGGRTPADLGPEHWWGSRAAYERWVSRVIGLFIPAVGRG